MVNKKIPTNIQRWKRNHSICLRIADLLFVLLFIKEVLQMKVCKWHSLLEGGKVLYFKCCLCRTACVFASLKFLRKFFYELDAVLKT